MNEGGRLQLTAVGAWTVKHARELDRIAASLTTAERAGPFQIDARDLSGLDTYGARVINGLCRDAVAISGEPRVIGLPAHYQNLYDQVCRATPGSAKTSFAKGSPIAALEDIGRAIYRVGDDFKSFLAMLGAFTVALAHKLARPATLRWTSTIHQLDRVGWQAVPIILLITFLIGAIIAQQGFFHFRKFGADEYVVDMVGILVLREIGVLIVAIMVAGRSGSAYTAELGSMKMREEVDALRTMGLDPVDVLVLPRVLALIIALPLLTFLGSMAALYGGGLTAWLYGGMSPEIFIARLRDAISITHFKVGLIKAPFMALVIGIVACAEGFAVKGSAESLGRQTTASVVKAIFLVIVLDGLFAVFFASIGM